MVALEPRVLSRVSFQLSFAVMTGIAIYYEALSDRIAERLGVGPERDGIRVTALRGLVGSVGVTLAATLATAPLLMFYFERVSLVGIPATLLSLPALPPALVAHGATALVGLVSETAAAPFGWFAWGLSSYITGVASLFGGIPAVSGDIGGMGITLIRVYYVALAALAILLYSPVPWRRWRVSIPSRIWEIEIPWQIPALASIMATIVWVAAFSQPDGTLKVMFADVGQGDMTVISTPSGHTVVVDGGPATDRAAYVLDAHTPFWKRTLSLVVLSHPHSDHVSGLNEIMRRYTVERVLERRRPYESADYLAWTRLADSEGAQMLRARPGMRLAFGDGVEIHVLGPPDTQSDDSPADANDASVIVRVVYGGASFLLTGDVFSAGERWLLRSGQVLDSDVLKVAHHGSKTSSSAPFLSAVSPRAAIISAGRDNRFGHPDPDIVERLEEIMPASRIFGTFESGTITFETDGKTMKVRTER